jgi:hypothetical protein
MPGILAQQGVSPIRQPADIVRYVVIANPKLWRGSVIHCVPSVFLLIGSLQVGAAAFPEVLERLLG